MAWKETNETFTNPYNFISLDDICLRPTSSEEIFNQSGLLTGWIQCTLTTRTSLFVPHSSNDNAFRLKDKEGNKIKSYDFFSYDNIEEQDRRNQYSEPVIPGSEIRGMIRSAYEAVTASCLSSIDKDRILYKRTSVPGQPGRLIQEQDGKWYILPCIKAGINIAYGNWDRNDPFALSSFQEGQKIYVQLGPKYKNKFFMYQVVQDIQSDPRKNYQEGYLHKGEPAERKHHESVFIPTQAPKIPLDEATLSRFKQNIKLYRDETVNIHKKKGTHQGYSEINLHDLNGVLIYYSKHCTNSGTVYYLSPAAISREVYFKTLNKIVDDFAPCEDTKKLCPSCTLFGMVGENGSLASRLRFTDGSVEEKKTNPKDYYEKEVILPELASPKLSASEFYLEKPPEADIWNYDYAGQWIRDDRGNATSPFSDIPYCPHIRGRKFYWHQNISQTPSITEAEATDRNVKIRPIQATLSFTFKIYFNSITTDELQKLCWVLNPDKPHCHKLGMGKPLGLGSIKIERNEIYVRKIAIQEKNIRYEFQKYSLPAYPSTQEDLAKFLGCKPNVLAEFLAITDWDQKPNGISYPQAANKDNESAIHYWFVANKQIPPAKGTNPILHQVLSSITERLNKKYRER